MPTFFSMVSIISLRNPDSDSVPSVRENNSRIRACDSLAWPASAAVLAGGQPFDVLDGRHGGTLAKYQ
jgi:hypothetical protein